MRGNRPLGRAIWAPVGAAVLSGLVIGGLARLLMRGVALAVDGSTGLSLLGPAVSGRSRKPRPRRCAPRTRDRSDLRIRVV
ncbi:hypothetical protein ACQP2K_08405 [Microbispora siamensis]